MFKTIQDKMNKDVDFPKRTFDLMVREAVLDGSIYDCIEHPFHEEYSINGDYIPLRHRRPCVRFNACRTVVNDSVSMLFSEGHFPQIKCDDDEEDNEDVVEVLNKLIKEKCINQLMINVATKGSVGSVAILFQVLKDKPYFKVLSTKYLTPEWDNEAPDTLKKVTEKYKVKGIDLYKLEYDIPEDRFKSDYWFMREWTSNSENRYIPWLVNDPESKKITFKPSIDPKNSTDHKLGFVPIVWIKNLPGGDDIDGLCTFPNEAIDNNIEVDYQLSQVGRGLRYSSDPMMVIKQPSSEDGGDMVKGGANALMLDKEGDAKFLEIQGSAAKAVMEYVDILCKLKIEMMRGNRLDPAKVGNATSGYALELMNQSLVFLSDTLRISYGEQGLLQLLYMVIKASSVYNIIINNKPIGKLNQECNLSLRWPNWYKSTYFDKQMEAATLTQLTQGELLSKETAINILSMNYDIENPEEEIENILNSQEKEMKDDNGNETNTINPGSNTNNINTRTKQKSKNTRKRNI